MGRGASGGSEVKRSAAFLSPEEEEPARHKPLPPASSPTPRPSPPAQQRTCLAGAESGDVFAWQRRRKQQEPPPHRGEAPALRPQHHRLLPRGPRLPSRLVRALLEPPKSSSAPALPPPLLWLRDDLPVLSVADYARKSVKLEGITSVAVRGADSVCVITQRTKAPAVSSRALSSTAECCSIGRKPMIIS